MKVIFLDIDGCLNEDTTPTRTKSRVIFIDKEKLDRLKKIVDATGAKIVLSSTWRYERNVPGRNGDFLELQEAFHILENHNNRVTNGDTTIFVGDMSMRGRSDELVGLVAQMKGKKILVRGNHDDVSDDRYANLFEEITDYKEMTISFGGKAYKIVICHFPILCWKDQHRGTILLYAHTHNSVEDDFFQDCIARMNASEELSLRRNGGQKIVAVNVGCMMPYMDYEPRTLQELLQGVGELPQ